jgi:hypothetical protein
VFGPLYFKNGVLRQKLTLSIKRLTFTSTESVHVCYKLLFKVETNQQITINLQNKLISKINILSCTFKFYCHDTVGKEEILKAEIHVIEYIHV